LITLPPSIADAADIIFIALRYYRRHHISLRLFRCLIFRALLMLIQVITPPFSLRHDASPLFARLPDYAIALMLRYH